ncbi:hypothetical protein D3C72_1578950 [compost metagenome]
MPVLDLIGRLKRIELKFLVVNLQNAFAIPSAVFVRMAFCLSKKVLTVLTLIGISIIPTGRQQKCAVMLQDARLVFVMSSSAIKNSLSLKQVRDL